MTGGAMTANNKRVVNMMKGGKKQEGEKTGGM